MERGSFRAAAAMGAGAMRRGLGLAALLLPLLLAAPAHAYIYWANGGTGAIGRAGNEGKPVEPEFIRGLGGPNGVAVDSGHIYWSDYNRSAIGRANLSGGSIETEWIKLPYAPSGVAVDSTHVYWSGATPGDIGRANLSGTSPAPEYIKNAAGACNLAVDGGHIYWTVGTLVTGYVARAGLDGKNVEGQFVEVPNVSLLCGVAVNSANVFWTDPGAGGGTNIGRADLSDPKNSVDRSFLGAASGPCGVAVFGSRIYWPNSGTSTIGRANTDATERDYEFIPTGAEPKKICGIAVDGLAPSPSPPAPSPGPGPGPAPPGPAPRDTTPPQTTISAGPGKKLSDGIAKFRFSSSEQGSSIECRLDSGKARHCSSPKSYRGLKPGRHVFQVWAIDAAGNRDRTPAKRRFRVPAAG